MKQIFFTLFFITSILNLSGQTKQNDIPWPTLADSPWPMIKHDPQFTGRSKYKGPQNGTIIWKRDLEHGIFSGPVLDKNDNLFFGSYYYHSDAFYSYTKDGSQRWKFELGQKRPPSSGILIDSSNTIYFGARDSNFYAMNPDGTLKWKINVSAEIPELAIINIDLNGNLYVTNIKGDLCSINPLGEINWKVKYESGFAASSPVFAPDGQTIYIAGRDSNLFALDLSGNIKWKFQCGKIKLAPVVNDYGNIIFIPNESPLCLKSIDKDGHINWDYLLRPNDPLDIWSIPAIDFDNNIFFINVDTVITTRWTLTSIDKNGQFRWKYIFGQDEGMGFTQPLIIDSEGTIYVGSTIGLLYYAISNDGNVKWTLRLNEHQVDNTGAIGEDGTLYLGLHVTSLWDQNEQNLIAIKDTNTVSVEGNISNVKEYSLSQNYPNPFNPSTTIKFAMPYKSDVQLKIFDMLGNEIRTFEYSENPAGYLEIFWDGKNNSGQTVSSGVYVYSVKAVSKEDIRKEFTGTSKLLIIK